MVYCHYCPGGRPLNIVKPLGWWMMHFFIASCCCLRLFWWWSKNTIKPFQDDPFLISHLVPGIIGLYRLANNGGTGILEKKKLLMLMASSGDACVQNNMDIDMDYQVTIDEFCLFFLKQYNMGSGAETVQNYISSIQRVLERDGDANDHGGDTLRNTGGKHEDRMVATF